MRHLIFSIGLLLLAGLASAATRLSGTALRYVDVQQASPNAVVVDTRDQAVCIQRSLAGAHCLPATDLLGTNGDLPSFADIFWALGTVGIDGSETILVTGDKPFTRNFVAGLLYFCGQARVEVLNVPIEKVLRAGMRDTGRGRARGILRQRIYHARMRDELLVLPAELASNRRNGQTVIPINAGKYSTATPDLSGLMHAHINDTGANTQFVIYASQPANAIALFAQLLAGTSGHIKGIRVMPVAKQGLFGYVDRHFTNSSSGLKPTFIAIFTRGEKQWI